jgi:AAHS family 4-hydroxybenzoate transporter-like MFS transporter
MEPTLRFDVDRFIDQQPFSRYQALIIALCGAALLTDGFDAQAIGFVAPALVQRLHIARTALGPVFSSGLLGIMIGALIFGPLADRVGRKPVLVFSALMFGVCSLLTATAGSLQTLLIFRLVTGLGLGGAMPNAVALTSEYMPKRLRATAVMILFFGFSMGAAVGGFVAAGMIERFGWQSVFLVGGALPCVIAVLLLALLPESIRFLVLKGGQEDRVARYLSKIAPDAPAPRGTTFAMEEQRSEGFLVKQLFTDGRTRMTLLLWVIYFMSLLDLYFLNAWLPTVMHDAGIALERAILVTSLFQVGGAVGSVTLGRLIDRIGSYRVLAWTYLAAGASIFFIGAAGASIVLLVCTISAAGFCVIGGQCGSNALAAESYPTPIRSTGVGWCFGIGRIGSIVGPALGGVLLASQGETRRVFWAAAVPVLIAGIAGFFAAATQSAAKSAAESSAGAQTDIIPA